MKLTGLNGRATCPSGVMEITLRVSTLLSSSSEGGGGGGSSPAVSGVLGGDAGTTLIGWEGGGLIGDGNGFVDCVEAVGCAGVCVDVVASNECCEMDWDRGDAGDSGGGGGASSW